MSSVGAAVSEVFLPCHFPHTASLNTAPKQLILLHPGKHSPPSLLHFYASLLSSSCSVLSAVPATPCQASLSFTISQSLFKFMSPESVMPSNHLILCPLLLHSSIFPRIRVFPSELALHIRRMKYWSFSISPFKEYSGLISFRIDWFDLFAVQGALKSLLQHHSLKLILTLVLITP